MIVETYEVTETTTAGEDPVLADAAAIELIRELDLEGQKELLAHDETAVIRIPYQRMTAEEVRVYQTLYPADEKVEAYRAGPIPLRVLQVVAHARTMFDKVLVWGPEQYDPDPVLVGQIGEYGNAEYYLLARWGDALAPFEELRDRAAEVVRRRYTSKAKEVVAQCQAFLAAPDASVERHLRGEWQNEPWT